MQWLIDLIIEAIGVPPCFIDRGDPAANDFRWESHLFDPTAFDLDLSGIVPEDATAVLLKILVNNAAVSAFVRLRTKGNVNWQNISQITTQTAGLVISADLVVPLPASRIVEMWVQPDIWGGIDITVKGWWL